MPQLTLEQFAHHLHQEVLAKTGEGGVSSDDSDQSRKRRGGINDDGMHPLREEMFTEAVLELLDARDEIDSWEICGYESKSIGSVPAAKLNAWALSGDGATLDLFVTLYHGTGRLAEVGKPEMRRHFELVLGFLKRALSGFHMRMEEASDAFNAAHKIHQAREALATVRLFFLSDGVVRSLDIAQEQVAGVDVQYVAWDLEKLSRLRVGERGVIELDLWNDYGGGIPCLKAPHDIGEYRTFLVFFPAPLLAQIYGAYGQRLLERNVRAFLQVKGKINKGLQTTLREQPERFLAYNNGLCCTAADVRIRQDRSDVPRLAWVKDFQIVNGGQTTASIFHAIKKEKLDLRGVTLQAKLTVISDPDQVAEIVPMISRFANSQNKVNGADFAANGKFHRDLEELSRTMYAPAASGMERGSHWYYERARGSYLDDKARQGTPARQKAWAIQNPAQQKFTKTDLAKYEHAWLGLPHLVCRGAEKNFEAFAARLEDDGEPHVDRGFFEQVVARVILWRSAEKAFDSLKLEGYRANSVAYAVSWLAERSGRRLDLDRIWRDQRVSDAVFGAIVVACREAHLFLSSRSGNVGEGSKRPETWGEFRDLSLEIATQWTSEMKDGAAVLYPPKQSSQESKAAREVVAQVDAAHWFSLAKWAKERGFLQGWERSIAFSLGRLAAQEKAPSDKQVVQGERILRRAQELGFSLRD
jgi:hypothetical protein